MIAEISWKTSSPSDSDDVVVNCIREAVARSGHQVGDCMIVERSHSEGMAHLEVFESIAGSFGWVDLLCEVEQILESSPFVGDVVG